MNKILDAIYGKVLLDGRKWTDLSSAQRDRIARKAAVILADSVNTSPIPSAMLVTVQMVDDIGSVVAEFRTRRSGGYVYRVFTR